MFPHVGDRRMPRLHEQTREASAEIAALEAGHAEGCLCWNIHYATAIAAIARAGQIPYSFWSNRVHEQGPRGWRMRSEDVKELVPTDQSAVWEWMP